MRPEVTGSCFSETDYQAAVAKQLDALRRGYLLLRAVGIRADDLGPFAVFLLCRAVADDAVVAERSKKITYTEIWVNTAAVVEQMTDDEKKELCARVCR